eukprot:2430463-Alexandrium_andersonii.AAC.1
MPQELAVHNKEWLGTEARGNGDSSGSQTGLHRDSTHDYGEQSSIGLHKGSLGVEWSWNAT